MLRLTALAVVATLSLVAAPVPAAAPHDHAAMQPPAAAARSTPAEGEVRKVDATKGKVVLKHGPLVALDMPPMTMEFTAKDPKALVSLKVGDKVRFTPEQAKDGTLVVTAIEPVKN